MTRRSAISIARERPSCMFGNPPGIRSSTIKKAGAYNIRCSSVSSCSAGKKSRWSTKILVVRRTARSALRGSQVLRTRLERYGDAQGGTERQRDPSKTGANDRCAFVRVKAIR
jgi:hypothetical protein